MRKYGLLVCVPLSSMIKGNCLPLFDRKVGPTEQSDVDNITNNANKMANEPQNPIWEWNLWQDLEESQESSQNFTIFLDLQISYAILDSDLPLLDRIRKEQKPIYKGCLWLVLILKIADTFDSDSESILVFLRPCLF